ncbi:MAG: glycosyltransferase family 4 protein [Candidatus Kerfeldbacteria bacterium]|nr:glycosyltransferase family 4 protein [Candidatus Kerfeldbacteria bacterium]
MNILQINKFYYRRRGAETYFLDLIDLLEQHGHTVGVFSMHHPNNLVSPYSQYFVANTELQQPDQLPMSTKLRTAKNIIWNKSAQQQLERLLQLFKPDVAHIHNIYHQISPAILKTLHQHGIPIVQTLHDYKLLCPNYRMFTQGQVCERCNGHNYYNAVRYNCLKNSRSASAVAMLEMYWHKAIRAYEKNVNCFISPSQFLHDKVLAWHEQVQHITVLPNFITLTGITPHYQHDHYILYAGALVKEKGIDLLLDSFAKNRYSFSLFVAGAGGDRSLQVMIKQAQNIGNTVKLLGELSAGALSQVTRQAMAVVVPSRYYENYPYSVLEAFAHGKPVLGANIGGIPELVHPGSTGWLFTANNQASLTTALQNIEHTTSPALVQLGKQARHWVEQHNHPPLHYEALLAIYQQYVNTSA